MSIFYIIKEIKMKTRYMTMFGLLLVGALALTACEKKGTAEEMGEKIDNAAEKAGDKIEDATEKAKEKVEAAADATKEKVEEMGDKIEDATDKK